MTYTTILFDLDHTLLDTDASERSAFAETMSKFNGSSADPYHGAYRRINRRLWDQVERGITTPDEVRTERFRQLVAETDLDASPHDMANHFAEGLGAHGSLFEGARSVLDHLMKRVTLALVTNGIGQVQRTRIDRLGIDKYFAAIVISGEVGAAKPGSAIFEMTFGDLGDPPKETVLMIGDSLTSDIQGGINYGIDTCWYNPHRHPAPNEINPTFEITALKDLVDRV
ncbi:MAG: YjjG family noncanonical pyrimidine nucleotidase [Acidimicrobiia bacterium]